MSRFEMEMAAPIEVFQLNKQFAEDTFEKKVSLGVGAYRTEEGLPWVLPVVRLAEKNLCVDDTINKEYFPVLGLEKFSFLATKLLLGGHCPAFIEQRAFGVQSLSGTGALRIGGEFLKNILSYDTIYVSKPTWGNHHLLFKNTGFKNVRTYRYWNQEDRCLDIKGLLEDLSHAPENSIILLHACAHNPTGCDPTQDQWKQIADLMEEKKLFPFFDSAYQGFASGDLEKDAWTVRYFVQRGFELFCAQSFAKNFGLYSLLHQCKIEPQSLMEWKLYVDERIGNLTIVTNSTNKPALIKSQMSLIVRGMYSNPPGHGAKIVSYILSNPELCDEWKQNIVSMSGRINEMRKLLRAALESRGTPGSWEHITTQIGMFSYTGLNERQSQYMIDKHHIYMLRSGRISMCGVTKSNVEYIANAIYDTVTSIPNKL